MKEAYLVIDSSSGSVRAYAVTPEGRLLTQSSREIQNVRDPLYPDALSFDPEALRQDLFAVCREAAAGVSDHRIVAVSAASQREGVVLLDKDDAPLAGYPNIDNRGQEWESGVPDRHGVYSIGGRWVSTLFPAVKFLGLRARRPELWERARRFTSISDWIGFLFTGRLGYEVSQADESLLFDVEKGEWSEELCRRFQISGEMLPPLLNSGEVLGPVLRDVGRALGIPEGTPFLVGGADTQLAVECCRPSVGDLVIVAGTTTPVVYVSDHYLVDRRERCWVNRHVTPGLFVVETNVGVSGMNYQRALETFYPGSSYAEAEADLADRVPGRCLASVGSMIFHKAQVTPNGGFFVNAPLDGELTRADLVLAVLLDYAFSFKTNFEQLQDIVQTRGGTLYGCGGGFLGRLLPQMLADLIQREIRVPKGFQYASCMGLIRQMNRRFGYEEGAGLSDGDAAVIRPGEPPVWLKHYEAWAEKRNSLNQS